MLPKTQDEEILTSSCKILRDFYDEIKAKTPSVIYLSVGMSLDYKIAIRNGSNMIRIGTSLFGSR